MRVGHGLTAEFADFVGHILRRIARAAAVQRATGIVDDDARAVFCKQQRVRAADAGTAAGDDRNFVFEQCHESPLVI